MVRGDHRALYFYFQSSATFLVKSGERKRVKKPMTSCGESPISRCFARSHHFGCSRLDEPSRRSACKTATKMIRAFCFCLTSPKDFVKPLSLVMEDRGSQRHPRSSGPRYVTGIPAVIRVHFMCRC